MMKKGPSKALSRVLSCSSSTARCLSEVTPTVSGVGLVEANDEVERNVVVRRDTATYGWHVARQTPGFSKRSSDTYRSMRTRLRPVGTSCPNCHLMLFLTGKDEL